jgi:hypothetical protein
MNNDKIDFYKNLLLDRFFWGGALSITTKIDLSSEEDVINTLDQVCKNENLTPLGSDWNEINYDEFKLLLNSAFQFNLGFSGHRVMSIEEAQSYFETLTNDFDISTSKYFTNCFNHSWDGENKGHTGNSISENTLDLAVSIVNCNKLLFVYFLFED